MFAAMGMEPTELEPITLLLQWGSRERVPVSIRPDATVGELKEAYALSIGEVTAERCRLLWRRRAFKSPFRFISFNVTPKLRIILGKIHRPPF